MRVSDSGLIVTVAVLTFNGEKYLRRILAALMTQDVAAKLDILVIDSGSTDATLSIVADFPVVRLHQIPNEEFGHGRTRNLAAEIARGEYIAYLTHDAIPSTDSWLREMLEPFSLDPRIVAVMGKQIPRPLCPPITKYEIGRVFAQFGPDFGTTIFYDAPFVAEMNAMSAITFYSDVNSATRTDFLRSKISYQDVRYAEDQLFGQDLIAEGYHKAYAPRAAVEHSNDLTIREFRLRTFDEIISLRELGRTIEPLSARAFVSNVLGGAWRDFRVIVKDRGYSRKRRLYWVAVNPILHYQKWAGFRAAARADLNDAHHLKSHSLEAVRKSEG
jgi:rhamnosyltransferase